VSDAWAVALAVATALGALSARPVPVWAAVAGAAAALAARRPLLLCLAAAALASTMGARAWAGLRLPPPHTAVAGPATLVTDPADGAFHSVRVELRLGRRRVVAFAHGRAAAALRPRLAGEVVRVAGRLRPVGGRRRAYLAHRHIAAQLDVTALTPAGRGTLPARLANRVRLLLLRGVETLPPGQRAMFAGFVLGDGRNQPPATVADFRAAGLTHLLVVSGENVAFVLAVFAPLLSFLGLRGRLVGGLAVLFLFGVLTRWEPSVLRAEAMAAIALLATYSARPVSTVRLLSLATAGLLLVDPLLVGSVGFLLSVAACAGIAALAGPLHRRFRLPLPLAVTVAAQVGVAPVLLPVFGSLPLAALPANLLAVPAAGPLMMWGMAAGVPAGLAGGRAGAALHLPTRLLMAWVEGVAHWAARLPLPRL